MTKRIEFDRERAVEMYKSGITPSQIGRELGVNYQTVISHLKKVGVYKMSGTIAMKKLSLANVSSLNSSSDNDNMKPANKKQETRKKAEKIVTMEEKIEYCNKKYGVGRWHFMTKEEFMDAVMYDRERFRDEENDY